MSAFPTLQQLDDAREKQDWTKAESWRLPEASGNDGTSAGETEWRLLMYHAEHSLHRHQWATAQDFAARALYSLPTPAAARSHAILSSFDILRWGCEGIVLLAGANILSSIELPVALKPDPKKGAGSQSTTFSPIEVLRSCETICDSVWNKQRLDSSAAQVTPAEWRVAPADCIMCLESFILRAALLLRCHQRELQLAQSCLVTWNTLRILLQSPSTPTPPPPAWTTPLLRKLLLASPRFVGLYHLATQRLPLQLHIASGGLLEELPITSSDPSRVDPGKPSLWSSCVLDGRLAEWCRPPQRFGSIRKFLSARALDIARFVLTDEVFPLPRSLYRSAADTLQRILLAHGGCAAPYTRPSARVTVVGHDSNSLPLVNLGHPEEELAVVCILLDATLFATFRRELSLSKSPAKVQESAAGEMFLVHDRLAISLLPYTSSQAMLYSPLRSARGELSCIDGPHSRQHSWGIRRARGAEGGVRSCCNRNEHVLATSLLDVEACPRFAKNDYFSQGMSLDLHGENEYLSRSSILSPKVRADEQTWCASSNHSLIISSTPQGAASPAHSSKVARDRRARPLRDSKGGGYTTPSRHHEDKAIIRAASSTSQRPEGVHSSAFRRRSACQSDKEKSPFDDLSPLRKARSSTASPPQLSTPKGRAQRGNGYLDNRTRAPLPSPMVALLERAGVLLHMYPGFWLRLGFSHLQGQNLLLAVRSFQQTRETFAGEGFIAAAALLREAEEQEKSLIRTTSLHVPFLTDERRQAQDVADGAQSHSSPLMTAIDKRGRDEALAIAHCLPNAVRPTAGGPTTNGVRGMRGPSDGDVSIASRDKSGKLTAGRNVSTSLNAAFATTRPSGAAAARAPGYRTLRDTACIGPSSVQAAQEYLQLAYSRRESFVKHADPHVVAVLEAEVGLNRTGRPRQVLERMTDIARRSSPHARARILGTCGIAALQSSKMAVGARERLRLQRLASDHLRRALDEDKGLAGASLALSASAAAYSLASLSSADETSSTETRTNGLMITTRGGSVDVRKLLRRSRMIIEQTRKRLDAELSTPLSEMRFLPNAWGLAVLLWSVDTSAFPVSTRDSDIEEDFFFPAPRLFSPTAAPPSSFTPHAIAGLPQPQAAGVSPGGVDEAMRRCIRGLREHPDSSLLLCLKALLTLASAQSLVTLCPVGEASFESLEEASTGLKSALRIVEGMLENIYLYEAQEGGSEYLTRNSPREGAPRNKEQLASDYISGAGELRDLSHAMPAKRLETAVSAHRESRPLKSLSPRACPSALQDNSYPPSIEDPCGGEWDLLLFRCVLCRLGGWCEGFARSVLACEHYLHQLEVQRAEDFLSLAYETAWLEAWTGRSESALARLEEILAMHPHHTSAWVLKASVLFRARGSVDDALSAIKMSDTAISSFPPAAAIAGEILLASGRKEEAFQLFERCAALRLVTPILSFDTIPIFLQ